MPNSVNTSLSTYTSLMRVTSAGRPYAKDMFDLYAALLIQLPLTDHRSLFRTYPSSFTTDEAVKCLADLKFTHIVRTPDPSDPTRQLATRTTTTFSMTPPMAKALGQHLLNARLIENAADPQNRTMKDKGIWQPTPKGKFMIQEFSKRAHVPISHMQQPLSRVESFKIFAFERLAEDDKLAFSRANMTEAFKTMMMWLPTEKLLADDVGGLKESSLKEYQYTFYGYQCFEWISEYTTVVTREEAEMIAAEFVLYGWINQILDKSDRANQSKDDSLTFKMTRNTLYYVTERGRKVLGWHDDPEAAAREASISSSSSSMREISQQKQAQASRLLPADAHATPSGIPAATITEHRQQMTLSSAEEAATQKLDFGFSKEGPSDEKDVNEAAERLSRLQSSSSSSVPEPSVSTTSQQSRDSGLDLPGAGGSGEDAASTRSRPISVVDPAAGAGEGELPTPSTDIVGYSGDETHAKDSQWTRLRQILQDPLVRMYFRDFMKANFCEENINFWVDYYNLRKKCRARASQKELLSDSYAIYDTYLGPNAHSEVNIDHALRQEIIQLVSSNFSVVSGPASDLPFAAGGGLPTAAHTTVVVNGSGTATLKALIRLYDRVNDHICRIMAQDTVPRFIRTQKYRDLVANSTIRDCLENQPSDSAESS